MGSKCPQTVRSGGRAGGGVVPVWSDRTEFGLIEPNKAATQTIVLNDINRRVATSRLAIDGIFEHIAQGTLRPTNYGLVYGAASEALRSFISGIEDKLSEVSSSQELDTFRDELFSAAETYGVPLDATLRRDIQRRRDSLEEREYEEDENPYRQAGPQTVTDEISDAEIKSIFSLMTSGPVS